MKIFLTNHQIEIINNLLKNCTDAHFSVLSKLLSKKDMHTSDINTLCDIINSEFMMKGLLPTFEPNDYGLELEGLLDEINRPRLDM